MTWNPLPVAARVLAYLERTLAGSSKRFQRGRPTDPAPKPRPVVQGRALRLCQPLDWENETRLAADFVATELACVQRGAVSGFLLGHCLVFGNDGFHNLVHDERAKREFEELCRRLAAARIPMLGCAVSRLNGGYTWTAFVASTDRLWLNELVWDCWYWANNTPPEWADQTDKLAAIDVTSNPRCRPLFSLN